MIQFGLLGEKLGHSFSPVIHGYLADYDYQLIEVEKDNLASFMKNKEFSGLNVTIPYKKAVMPFLDEISDRAKSIGCVNTVKKREDGTLFGDNTDYDGFLYLLKSNNVDVNGAKALVLGSGGGSLTVRTVLKEQGAREIVIISRSGENNYENISKHYDADVIVNTTPIGMYPNNGERLVELAKFTNLKACLDIVYNPILTQFLLDAKRLGIVYANGLSMLVAQAKRASEIFTGRNIDDSEVDRITRILENEKLNIVIIGMPGSGKSSIGRVVAEKLNREFIDADDAITEDIGMPIPEFFAKYGEGEFRKVETRIVSQISKKTGIVLATGGGVITRPENYDLLKQNGIIVKINRPLNELSVNGRPLSQSRSVEVLAAERMPLYNSWADNQFDNEGIRKTAKSIISFYGLVK